MNSLLKTLVLAAAVCGEASAEDFTLNIPIELHNIPKEMSQWLVMVTVFDINNPQEITAQNIYNFEVPNGEYVQTMTVKFNARPGKQPGRANYYTVGLECAPTGTSGYNTPDIMMGPHSYYPYDPNKPLIFFVRGPLRPGNMVLPNPLRIPPLHPVFKKP